MAEQLPSADNRIVPDYDHRDAIGLPRPRITFTIDDYTPQRARARPPHPRADLRGDEVPPRCTTATMSSASGHVIGTYRMGPDPKQSVVNPDQRAHDHPNLFLLGSGVFPTSAASNPTLTIAALALRAVRAIERTRGRLTARLLIDPAVWMRKRRIRRLRCPSRR